MIPIKTLHICDKLVQKRDFFVDPFYYLCFVFVCNTYCMFLVALWSPAGKGLTSWFSCMRCFLCFVTFPVSGVVFDS